MIFIRKVFVIFLCLLTIFFSGCQLKDNNIILDPPQLRNAEDIKSLSTAFLVKIKSSSQNLGETKYASGAIIAKHRNTYYVLTVAHIVDNNIDPTITTQDGVTYQVKQKSIKKIKEYDLAVLKFNSNNSYKVSYLATYLLENASNSRTFISGWSNNNSQFNFTVGKRFNRRIVYDSEKFFISFVEQSNGYELIYSNTSKPGMSGSPVMDAHSNIIGINAGIHAEYYRGDTVEGFYNNEIQIGYSYGISITNFLLNLDRFKINGKWLNTSSDIPKKYTKEEKQKLIQVDNEEKASFNLHSTTGLLNYGNSLWRKGKYDDAIVVFDKILLSDQTNAYAHYAKGLALSSKKELNLALDSFDNAIDYSQYFIPAWYEKGKKLYFLKQYADAKYIFEKCLSLSLNKTSDREIYGYQWWLADTLVKLKKYNLAIDLYSKIISRHSTYYAYIQRANAYSKVNNFQKAIKDYELAISYRPQKHEAYFNRGILYLSNNKLNQAASDLDNAIDIEPNLDMAYLFRGLVVLGWTPEHLKLNSYRVRFDNKYYEKVLYYFNKSLSINPNNSIVYFYKGSLSYIKKDYRQCISNSSKAISSNITNLFKVSSYLLRAECNIELGTRRNLIFKKYYRNNIDSAVSDLNNAIEINPNFAGAYHTRGRVFNDIFRDYEKASKDYFRAAKLYKQNGNKSQHEQIMKRINYLRGSRWVNFRKWGLRSKRTINNAKPSNLMEKTL